VAPTPPQVAVAKAEPQPERQAPAGELQRLEPAPEYRGGQGTRSASVLLLRQDKLVLPTSVSFPSALMVQLRAPGGVIKRFCPAKLQTQVRVVHFRAPVK